MEIAVSQALMAPLRRASTNPRKSSASGCAFGVLLAPSAAQRSPVATHGLETTPLRTPLGERWLASARAELRLSREVTGHAR